MVIEQATPDKAVAALQQYGGTVIKTSLSDEDTKKLQDALAPPASPRRLRAHRNVQAKEISMPIVGAETHQNALRRIGRQLDFLEQAMGLREIDLEASGLDSRTFALVKIAALIALDAPPASYAWQVANALEEGSPRRTSSAS